MDSNFSIKFFNKIKTMDDRNCLLATIMFHAAPTLAGKKPSCLINLANDKRGLYHIWDTYKNQILKPFTIDYFEILRDTNRVLVFLYDSQSLEEIINNPDNIKFLKEMGYGDITSIKEGLEILRERFKCGFPHEIGILLGIPCEDVEGFIRNSGMNFIMNGYWKVYSKPQRAEELFHEYDRARISAMKSIMKEMQ